MQDGGGGRVEAGEWKQNKNIFLTFTFKYHWWECNLARLLDRQIANDYHNFKYASPFALAGASS